MTADLYDYQQHPQHPWRRPLLADGPGDWEIDNERLPWLLTPAELRQP